MLFCIRPRARLHDSAEDMCLLRVWEARALRQSALLNFKLSCLEEKSARCCSGVLWANFAPDGSESMGEDIKGRCVTHSKLCLFLMLNSISLSKIRPRGSWLVSAILDVGHLISFLFFSSLHSMALFVWLPRFHAWTQSEIYILKRPYCSPFRRQLMSITSWDEGRERRERKSQKRDVTLYCLINRCITNYSLNTVSHIDKFTQTSLFLLPINQKYLTKQFCQLWNFLCCKRMVPF